MKINELMQHTHIPFTISHPLIFIAFQDQVLKRTFSITFHDLASNVSFFWNIIPYSGTLYLESF